MTAIAEIQQAAQQYKANQITLEQYEQVCAKFIPAPDFTTMTDEEAIAYCRKQEDPEYFLHEELMNLLPGVPSPDGLETWIDTERYERLQEMFG